MKNKRKGHFLIYIIVLFFLCMVLDDILSAFYDFCVGFYAGFQGLEPDYEWAREITEGLRHHDWVAVVPIAIVFSYVVKELDNAKRNKELQERRNQQLYAGIAHDLKTPMTMIKGYAKVLESEKSLSEEEKRRYLKTIVEQTDHANSLLDSLLAYSKLENQSYQLKKEKKDLAECLRVCVADYYPMLEQADIQPELLIPDTRVEFCFDELEMKRAFTNLLSNMVKHNPKKTTCIIQLEEKIVREDGAKAVRIVIADNGPKIPEELKDKLFEPFTVGDASRNTKNGSGLGLSISKKIVERHEGTIRYVENWRDGYKGFVIELEG